MFASNSSTGRFVCCLEGGVMTCSGFEERRLVPRRSSATRGGGRGGLCPRERAPRRGANCAQRPVLAHGTPEASAGGGAATCMPKLRTPIEGWLEREIAWTTYPGAGCAGRRA